MTTQELVNLINLEADELLDTDEDNIPYVNHAIDLLSFFLSDDPSLISVAMSMTRRPASYSLLLPSFNVIFMILILSL